jgi:hypothetical protein
MDARKCRGKVPAKRWWGSTYCTFFLFVFGVAKKIKIVTLEMKWVSLFWSTIRDWQLPVAAIWSVAAEPVPVRLELSQECQCWHHVMSCWVHGTSAPYRIKQFEFDSIQIYSSWIWTEINSIRFEYSHSRFNSNDLSDSNSLEKVQLFKAFEPFESYHSNHLSQSRDLNYSNGEQYED